MSLLFVDRSKSYAVEADILATQVFLKLSSYLQSPHVFFWQLSVVSIA